MALALSASRARHALLGLLITLGVVGTSHAQGLVVTPVRPELTIGQTSSNLTLTNQQSKTSYVQVRVFRWTQDQGQDGYSPTTDVTASPALVSLAPGASQTIRLVHAAGPVKEGEQAYRVILDELPVAKPGDGDAAEKRITVGLNFRLQLSLPLFVGRPANAKPILHLSQRTNDKGYRQLGVRNQGNATAMIESHSGLLKGSGLLGYVQPGQTRWLDFAPGSRPGKSVPLKVNGDDVSLPLE